MSAMIPGGRGPSDLAEPIAVVGLAGIFPDAANLAAFESNLRAGRCAIRPVSRERRWYAGQSAEGFYQMAALDRVDLFDREFFGISAAEAEAIDPHHRLALELAWSAVEDAAIPLARLRGDRTGVFLSAAASRYSTLFESPSTLSYVGSAPSGVAGRISYHLGLTGPSMAVDTGCSGSLVAMSLAADALRARRCRFALAGGVSVRIDFPSGDDLAQFAEVMSPDGYCRAFDADAGGTADGEGGAILLLERLPDALTSGHPVLSTIRSIAVNHNADRAVGLTAPSADAQVELLHDAWRQAGLDLGQVRFVEAHGSGTQLGDAIELTALDRAVRSYGAAPQPIPVGSVKANIGHLDHAAGMAGLCKAMLGLASGTVFETVNFRRLNPAAELSGRAVRVATAREAFSVSPSHAAIISSFGITGVNAHAVIGAGSAVAVDDAPDYGTLAGLTLVTLSAASAPALEQYRVVVADALAAADPPPRLHAVAATLNVGRADLGVRWAAAVPSIAELVRQLRLPAEPARRQRSASPRAVAAVFSDDHEPADRYHALVSAGVRPDFHLATGRGHLALAQIGHGVAGADPAAPLDREALRAVTRRLADRDPLYLILGPEDSELATALADLGLDIVGGGSADPAVIAAELYRRGADLDWSAWAAGRRHERAALPSYPFQRERCWPVPPGSAAAQAPRGGRPAAAGGRADAGAVIRAEAAALLGVPDVGAEANYFALGGNSLLGLELLTRVQQRLGVTLTLPDLYLNPVLSDLASVATARSHSGAAAGPDPIHARGELEAPLSFGQESLFFLSELDPDSVVYNVTADMRLSGSLDIPALERALNCLAHRHDVLTCHYERRASGVVAIVDPRLRIELPVYDIPPGAPAERQDAAAGLATRIALAPYDLMRGPLCRFALLRFDEGDHVLIFGSHHTVDDGWSPAIVDHELSVLYESEVSGRPAELSPLPIRYGDYAQWQRDLLSGASLDEGLQFWREHLDGCQPADLAADLPRPRRLSDRGEHVELRLSAGQVRRMRELASREECTLFVVTLAAFEATLFRYSQTGDFAVGVVVSGRDRPETRGLIGYFNNMVALRARRTPGVTFAGLIDQVRSGFVATAAHHQIPFAKVVEALRPSRDLSRHPIFQVGFTYQTIPLLEERLGNLAARPGEGTPFLSGLAPGRAPWDLNLTVWDVEGVAEFKVVFEFAADLFDRATGEDFAAHFAALLDAAIERPDVTMDELAPAAGARAEGCEAVAADSFPLVSAEQESVLDTVFRLGTSDPDRDAVVADTGTLDYGQLSARVRSFAARLGQRGVRPGDIVALLGGRKPDTVVAMLGTWAAGAVCMPVDPGYPPARVQAMLAVAQARLVIYPADGPEPGAPWSAVRMDEITAPHAEGFAATTEEPAAGPFPDPARYLPQWLVFTSGSTGDPKGVLAGGDAVAPFVAAWRGIAEEVGEPLRVLTTASPAFDVFIGDLIRAVAGGGALVLVPPERLARPADVVHAIRSHDVTAVEFIPAELRDEVFAWLAARLETLPRLSLVINGLNSWTGADVARMLGRCAPAAVAMSVFGTTEGIIDNLADLTREPDAAISDPRPRPVGRPLAGVRAYVLDENLRAAPRGAAGELCLGGCGLAYGYLADPALTADRFRPDPFSHVPGARIYRTGDRIRRLPEGPLAFLGRMDARLKVNGYRIEPGEVEAALRRHPAVLAAVVGTGGPDGTSDSASQLTAWVAAGPDGMAAAPTPAELRRHARSLLPDFLVPARIVVLPELPLTPNGKPDQDALRTAASAPVADQPRPAPRSALELELAAVFGEVLGSGPIGIHDDFFQRGGHSLLALRLTADIEARFGVRLPVAALFEDATVAGAAALLRSEHPARTMPLITLAEGGGVPLILCEPSGGTSFCYQPLARSLTPGRRVLGLQSAGIDGDRLPLRSMTEIADHHATVITAVGIDKPVMVGGWSYGGVLAHALSARLSASGVPVLLTIILDAAPRDVVPRRLPERDDALLRHLLLLSHDFIPGADLGSPGDTAAGDPIARLLISAQAEGLLPPGLTRDGLASLLAVLRANEEAASAYEPERLDGDLLLFRTAGGPEPDHNDLPDLGWAPYARRVSVCPVKGDHYSLIPVDFAALARDVSAELMARGL